MREIHAEPSPHSERVIVNAMQFKSFNAVWYLSESAQKLACASVEQNSTVGKTGVVHCVPDIRKSCLKA